METVSVDLLRALAASIPTPDRPPRVGDSTFDLTGWIHTHDLDVAGPTDWQGGQRWIFRVCPWNSDHTNRAAYLVRLKNGAIAAGCHHNGCSGKDWYALRDLLEPGWREKNGKQNGRVPGLYTEILDALSPLAGDADGLRAKALDMRLDIGRLTSAEQLGIATWLESAGMTARWATEFRRAVR
jgi:hypothetical protein